MRVLTLKNGIDLDQGVGGKWRDEVMGTVLANYRGKGNRDV